MTTPALPTLMDIHEVLDMLPHRYPILLVDRVISLDPHKSIVALKNVSINEPYFTGHFPHRPVMPGVLILEALAQAAGILVLKSMGVKPDASMVYYFVAIDKARFKKPVEPGDQLLLNVSIKRSAVGVWKFEANATVDGKIVTEAELMCAVRPIEKTEKAEKPAADTPPPLQA